MTAPPTADTTLRPDVFVSPALEVTRSYRVYTDARARAQAARDCMQVASTYMCEAIQCGDLFEDEERLLIQGDDRLSEATRELGFRVRQAIAAFDRALSGN